MPRLLVVDDEAAVRYSFQRIYSSGDVDVVVASNAAEALERIEAEPFDVVILDVQLPGGTGLELFPELQALDPRRPIIFITAHGSADTAIEAMKHGAFDYLVKPLDVGKLTQILDRAFAAAQMMRVPALLPTESPTVRIIGRSAVIQEMSKAIGRIAPQDVNVLIVGETGAGKELVARAIYHHSRRADKPFMAINCAAIPENLLESELFGHEEGAFTGASRRRIGKFEQCNGGTFFLDEIGDMALPLQAKLLRVLQENEFEPVGGNRVVKAQVRIVAATNQNLESAMNEGRFRKDLFFRLRDVMIPVPPLRERRDDISELAHHFLFAFGREIGRDIRGFSPAALDALIQYDWPGNVRELQGSIKQAVLASVGSLIELIDFPEPIRKAASGVSAAGEPDEESLDVIPLIKTLLRNNEKDIHSRVIGQVERAMFSLVLSSTNLSQVCASEILGLNRATLRSKLRDYGLTLGRTLAEEKPAEEE